MANYEGDKTRPRAGDGSRILLMDPPPRGTYSATATDTQRFDPQSLIASLERRDALSDEERQALRDLPWRLKRYGDGEEIVAEASRPTDSCLLVDGLAARSRQLANGNRQLTALHVPGDFVDLHGFFLKIMDHAVIALMPVTVAMVPHRDVQRLATQMPHLGRMLFMMVAIDAAIQRNWIACMGRMEPIRHLAYLVCEVYKRLEVVGRVENGSFEFPLTQAEIADLVGLSIVHTNRTLQELRATGLVTWKGNRIVICDWDGLARLADFDPTYLNLFHHPR
ncbi:Crp/Fnr family transcriptional regulator [Aquibium sp. ELW1220]|uniref:Crp/Fnr family transcriptional regulator n=1 Tax=Aquibium sp. ELW1220 TaxID=2976766 RepID=UPI0025AFE53D|nr:Crp/Fnr family transcriptional regulator [Aquibium sp. ELW1220]MDN2582828.1 Crp/Fnr family transcriptional regulator [Aquibium sp. ELW1220]